MIKVFDKNMNRHIGYAHLIVNNYKYYVLWIGNK